MEITPNIKTFHIIPFICLISYKNPLTKYSQKSFDYEWNDFYAIKIGWLKYEFEFFLK